MMDVSNVSDDAPQGSTASARGNGQPMKSDEAIKHTRQLHVSSRLQEALQNESLSRQKPVVQATTSTPLNAEAFLNGISKKRDREDAGLDEARSKKIPTGPRALNQNINSRVPENSRHRQDVTALSLLNNSKSATSSTSRNSQGLGTSFDGASPHVTPESTPKGDVGKPRVFKKRPPADPLRRNLGNRPR